MIAHQNHAVATAPWRSARSACSRPGGPRSVWVRDVRWLHNRGALPNDFDHDDHDFACAQVLCAATVAPATAQASIEY